MTIGASEGETVRPATRASRRAPVGDSPPRSATDVAPQRGSSSLGSDWRTSNRTDVAKSARVGAVCLLGAGLGMVGAAFVTASGNRDGLLSISTLWIGMVVAIIVAFATQRYQGLFSFKPVDVVWGIGLAALLRLASGTFTGADETPFPIAAGADAPWATWIMRAVLPAGLVGPVVEELFFRAVILVVVYRLTTPRLGRVIGGTLAALLSTAGFVLVHVVFTPLAAPDTLLLILVGLACASLVLLTGRLWGALLVHLGYNLSYLALAALGTMLS